MNKQMILGALVALIGITAASSLYTVREFEQILVFQFGEIVRAETEAGLKWKIPLIQNIMRVEKRLLPLETGRLNLALATEGESRQVERSLTEVLENDIDAEAEELLRVAQAQVGERLEVEAFARYMILDPVLFYESFGSEQAVQDRISSPLQNAIRTTLAKLRLEDVLANQRKPIETYKFENIDLKHAYRELLLTRADSEDARERVMAGDHPDPSVTDIIAAVLNQRDNVLGTGVWIRDVRFFNVSLPTTNRDAIYRRMITERQSLAEQLRAAGRARALEIRSNAEKERDVRLAEAQAEAERIRGRGDATAIRVYGEAYNQDADFYAFHRSLAAYRAALANDSTTMVLSPQGSFFTYFGTQQGD